MEHGSLPLEIDDVHVLLQGQFLTDVYSIRFGYFIFMLADGLPVILDPFGMKKTGFKPPPGLNGFTKNTVYFNN